MKTIQRLGTVVSLLTRPVCIWSSMRTVLMLSPGECCSPSLTGLPGKVFKVIESACVYWWGSWSGFKLASRLDMSSSWWRAGRWADKANCSLILGSPSQYLFLWLCFGGIGGTAVWTGRSFDCSVPGIWPPSTKFRPHHLGGWKKEEKMKLLSSIL